MHRLLETLVSKQEKVKLRIELPSKTHCWILPHLKYTILKSRWTIIFLTSIKECSINQSLSHLHRQQLIETGLKLVVQGAISIAKRNKCSQIRQNYPQNQVEVDPWLLNARISLSRKFLFKSSKVPLKSPPVRKEKFCIKKGQEQFHNRDPAVTKWIPKSSNFTEDRTATNQAQNLGRELVLKRALDRENPTINLITRASQVQGSQ